MHAHDSTHSWQIRHIRLDDAKIQEPLDHEIIPQILESWDPRTLQDQEARTWIVPCGDQHWHVIAIRDSNDVFMQFRPRRQEQENFERIAMLYSSLALGLDATVFTDVQGALLGASRRWRAIYGYELAEVLGKNPRVINSRTHPAEFFHQMWQSLTNRNIGSWSREITNRSKTGELIPVWQTIITVRSPHGSIEGYLGMTRDMRGQAEMRQRLARENAELTRLNGFKTELMAIAAHDLKSPLHGLLGYADLIESGIQNLPAEKLTAYAAKIKTVGAGMLQLVQNILDLQKAEQGRMTFDASRCHLGPLLRTAADLHAMQAVAKNIRIRVEIEPGLPPVFADVSKLEQAVANLLSNSLKFSPDGSEIVLQCLKSPDGYTVRVIDSGPGIPESMLQRVFEPYEQVAGNPHKTAGTGWGLAIVKRVAELHGGKCCAENRSIGGAVLEITLPCHYELFVLRPWAAVIQEPIGPAAHHLAESLQSAGVPVFRTSDAEETRAIALEQLPNILVLHGQAAPQWLNELCDPDKNRVLQPHLGLVPKSPVGAHIKWLTKPPLIDNSQSESNR